MVFNEDMCSAGYGEYCQPTGYNIPAFNPNVRISTNQSTGQIQVNQNVGVQKWIDAALSGLALIRGAQAVPTYSQNQPQYQQAQYTPEQLAAIYGNGNQNGLGLDSFIQNNKGMLLIVGVGVALFMMKPPSRR